MEIKKHFDIKTLPLRFYAHTMQFVNRDPYDNRCAVTFEAVLKDHIQMFVTGVEPKELPDVARKSTYYPSLWEHFKSGGINDEDFLKNKDIYMAQAGNAFIALMFPSFIKAKEIINAKNDWWEITVLPPVNNADKSCILDITCYAEIEGGFPFEMSPVSREEEKALHRLYTPDKEEEETRSNADTFNAIEDTTTYSEVRVLYVGAGLCCCVIDGATGNTPALYYDMGIENARSSNQLSKKWPAASVLMHDIKAANVADVVLDAMNYNFDVIISHWHDDHTNILNEMAVDFVNTTSPTCAFWLNFFQNTTIINPGIHYKWEKIHYTAVRGAMKYINNKQSFISIPYESLDQSFSHFQTPPHNNLELWKCDRNDEHLAEPDPHDHGLTLLLKLTSGNTVYLAGDCYYDTVSVNNKDAPILTNGYDYLVVCHHGGKYTNTSARGFEDYIPKPKARPPGGANRVAFYSANGVSYSHPTVDSLAAHEAAGWASFMLYSLPLEGRSFIYMK